MHYFTPCLFMLCLVLLIAGYSMRYFTPCLFMLCLVLLIAGYSMRYFTPCLFMLCLVLLIAGYSMRYFTPCLFMICLVLLIADVKCRKKHRKKDIVKEEEQEKWEGQMEEKDKQKEERENKKEEKENKKKEKENKKEKKENKNEKKENKKEEKENKKEEMKNKKEEKEKRKEQKKNKKEEEKKKKSKETDKKKKEGQPVLMPESEKGNKLGEMGNVNLTEALQGLKTPGRNGHPIFTEDELNLIINALDSYRKWVAAQTGMNASDVGQLGSPFIGDTLIDPELARSLGGFSGTDSTRRRKREFVSSPSKLWPTTEIYYTFDTGATAVTAANKAVVQGAFRFYTENTCLNFIEFSGVVPPVAGGDYIRVFDIVPTSSGWCFANLGKKSGENIVNMDPQCANIGVALHEIGHILGVFHEQSRQDRDKFVTIEWDNIDPGTISNFLICSASQCRVADYPYDYGSIMHYTQNAYLKAGLTHPPHRTIKTTKPEYQATIGYYGTPITFYDLKAINTVYCGVAPSTGHQLMNSPCLPSTNPCQNEGYLNPANPSCNECLCSEAYDPATNCATRGGITSCGAHLAGSTMQESFSSYGYAPNDETCVWIITCDASQLVEYSFSEFQFTQFQYCGWGSNTVTAPGAATRKSKSNEVIFIRRDLLSWFNPFNRPDNRFSIVYKCIPNPDAVCNSNPCYNGGTCEKKGANEYTCQCPAGYLGRNCELKGCAFNSSYNNQQLFLDYDMLVSEDAVSCERDDCSELPCTCTAKAGGILHSYFDTSRPPHGCGAVSIVRNGVCEDIGDHCSIGCDFTSLQFYVSPNINRPIEKFICGACNACNSNPCQHCGTCIDQGSGAYSCKCSPGYVGTNCETKGCTFNSTHDNNQVFADYGKLVASGILSCEADDCSVLSCTCTIRPGGLLHSYFDTRAPPTGCGTVSIERNGVCENLADQCSFGCDYSNLTLHVSPDTNKPIEKFICGTCDTLRCNNATLRTCGEIKEADPTATSGVYQIRLFNDSSCHGIPGLLQDGACCLTVYCDMKTLGGGWTVFQRRMNGEENFKRNWTDYKQGFGNVAKEHWLGNDAIHHLTFNMDSTVELLVELQETGRSCVLNARYSSFYIGNENENYKLFLGKFTGGSAGDSPRPKGGLLYHNGMEFSTPDRDNDKRPQGNCARDGGWWFGNCHNVFLNGLYSHCTCVAEKFPHIDWVCAHGVYYSFPWTEMKMRRTDFKWDRQKTPKDTSPFSLSCFSDWETKKTTGAHRYLVTSSVNKTHRVPDRR